MNRIFLGDNLPILRHLAAESVDLIYVDPPFNTRRTQKRTTIKTVRAEDGDRKGFQGHKYRTIELGTKSYEDSLESGEYIHEFLRPRLVEAHRLLKPHGSLYFHIDYREVHYCKILLDEIFGRASFLNEIIWAYDYGGRARSKWPAKHDNILFYVKDPKNYIFNSGAIDREPYMAPGLVGPEKAEAGKLPTDVWWPGHLAARLSDASAWFLRGQNALWWQTIVPTNSRERVGYPTQKPRRLLDRIIKASSVPGGVVLDFFAGSGTTGESCLALEREFILVDDNPVALEVMAQRFWKTRNIEWVNFDPEPYRSGERASEPFEDDGLPGLDQDVVALAAAAGPLQKRQVAAAWEHSPFEWVPGLSAAEKNRLGTQLLLEWSAQKNFPAEAGPDAKTQVLIGGQVAELRLSTVSKSGSYRFRGLRPGKYGQLICLGISPFEAHCWVISRAKLEKHVLGRNAAEASSLTVDPRLPPDWLRSCGGTLDQAARLLKDIARPKK